MLPLSLLNAAQNKPMLVELKNGSTFNGHLVACDNFMNLTLREVYETSASGEQFWKQKECYIRGSTIKYCRVADSVIDQVKEQEEVARKQRQQGGGGLSGGVSLGHNRGGGGGHAHGGRGGYQNRGGGRGGHNTEQRGGRGGHRGRGRGQ
uniref:LSM complex subunit LSM4 n=1 Tax=Melanopsichium pennsylvanicum 4 TaxID=1398559 RepID=A0A077R7Y8_9BASI|nr:related to U6 snRNA-associated Sm-like protein LSm4 [Melanopsichium pennsylvanicum 4]